MDPDANLKELLEQSRAWQETETTSSADRMAELVIALDEWIRKGGFLPQVWGKVGHSSPPPVHSHTRYCSVCNYEGLPVECPKCGGLTLPTICSGCTT